MGLNRKGMKPPGSHLTDKIAEVSRKVKQTELDRKLKERGFISDPIGKTQEEYEARAQALFGKENVPFLSREQQRTERIERERKRTETEDETPPPDKPPDLAKPPTSEKIEKWDSLEEMRKKIDQGNTDLARSSFQRKIGMRKDREDAKRQKERFEADLRREGPTVEEDSGAIQEEEFEDIFREQLERMEEFSEPSEPEIIPESAEEMFNEMDVEDLVMEGSQIEIDSDPENIERNDVEMTDVMITKIERENQVETLRNLNRSMKCLGNLLKNRNQKPSVQEVNDWITEVWANHRENAKTPRAVLFTDARDATANFWRMKEDSTNSQMILEREYPGMRKEIPECETFNKYGNAARKSK